MAASRPSNITASRKALEAKFDLTIKTLDANMRAYLKAEREALVKEFDQRLTEQAQLPGVDISSYQVFQKFVFLWMYQDSKVVQAKVGDQILANVTVEPGKNYEGFFLFRETPPKEAKKE